MLSFDALCNTQTNIVEFFVQNNPEVEHITRVRVLIQNEYNYSLNCEKNTNNNNINNTLLDLLDDDHWRDGLFHGNNKFVFSRPLLLSTCSIMWCLLEVKEMHIETVSKVIQCALDTNNRKELEEEESEKEEWKRWNNIYSPNECESNAESNAFRRGIAEAIKYEVYLIPFTVEKVVKLESQKEHNNNTSTAVKYHPDVNCNVFILHGVAKYVVNSVDCDNINNVSSLWNSKINNKRQSQTSVALHNVESTIKCEQSTHSLQLKHEQEEEEQNTRQSVSAASAEVHLMISDIPKLRNLLSLHNISKLMSE